jgi:hypothetical protein
MGLRRAVIRQNGCGMLSSRLFVGAFLWSWHSFMVYVRGIGMSYFL